MSSSDNALNHGAFSKITVMSWESQEEFDSLLYELILELDPFGALDRGARCRCGRNRGQLGLAKLLFDIIERLRLPIA